MIYCVVPPELEDELYERLVDHYKDNPNVQVIIDRRTGPDPRHAQAAGGEAEERRVTRDRRRPRAPGTFPAIDAHEE